MKGLHHVKCPICGAENRGLILSETEGWFLCERCGSEVRSPEYRSQRKTAPRRKPASQNKSIVQREMG